MELAALISGGKDSMLALYRMHLSGHKIKYLLAMEPETTESYMFHHPNIWVTDLISKSMGIPLLMGRTHGRKEEELNDLKSLISKVTSKVDGITTGALASTYQKTRIDAVCKELSLKSISPLWQIEPQTMWTELLDHGFEVMVTAVAAEGLGEEWLGRIVDETALIELKELSGKYRFHLGFEGGEAETLVVNMPLYKAKIRVTAARPVWMGNHGFHVIVGAILETCI